MPGLQLFKKGFYSHIGANQPIVAATINLGSTKGRGSSTRIFNYCNQHSANPSECINQFINIIPAPAPAPPPPPPPPQSPPLPQSPPPQIKSIERPKSEIRREEQTIKTPKAADLDLFADEEPTFNMKLKEAREQTLPPKQEPVEHLKQLISINDKFIFINELFDGNLKEYNEAIETLDGFRAKNDAYNYLDLLRKKNLWELESGTLMKLKEIVEKKF